MNPFKSKHMAIDNEPLMIDVRRELDMPLRRLFSKRIVTLRGLVMLSGCSLSDDKSVENFLSRVSRVNDSVQAWLFDPKRQAPTYTEAQITRPFPFYAFYGESDAPEVDGPDFRLKVGGLVRSDRPWTLPELYALPAAEQITRHFAWKDGAPLVDGGHAVFGISQAGWSRYISTHVAFKCVNDDYESIDMATALHPQTLPAFTYDGHQLPRKYGYPMKLQMPTKLGYKNPKHIMEIFVTNTYPGGYWVDQGYNWFGGSLRSENVARQIPQFSPARPDIFP